MVVMEVEAIERKVRGPLSLYKLLQCDCRNLF